MLLLYINTHTHTHTHIYILYIHIKIFICTYIYTLYKKVGTGSNKRPEKLNVHIRNSWRTNLQLIRSIGNMIGYKKSLSERQCLSEVKMGRGSRIPPMLQRKIVDQYQKGVSQRKIAKSLKLSSSTVLNIIQRFRESGTISVRKGQGRKTILDACDLRALRRTASHTGMLL